MKRALFTIVLLAVPIAFAQSNVPDWWKHGAQEKMCGLGTYHDSLDLAFKNATAERGETLVTVQVLPSFQNENALVLTRVGSELKLLRVSFQEQLWHQLGPLGPKSRQQCLELAMAAKVNTTEVHASPQTITQLWTEFNNINLATKPPRFDTLDGTTYIVQTKDGLSLVLLNAEEKGFTSENRALRAWVRSLLDTARNSQP